MVVSCCILASCRTMDTRTSLYGKMYEEKPIVMLVMPPINNTTNVEAKELFYTSISHPLIESGYYVISPHLAMDIFKSESAYDAEMFIENDIATFGRIFGADAAVFTIIDKWEKRGVGIETQVTCIIKSTRTNDILFERTCDLYLDMGSDGNGKTSLVTLAIGAIQTALTDHIEAARKCNNYIFMDIPRGKYHPDYMKDQTTRAYPKNIRAVVR